MRAVVEGDGGSEIGLAADIWDQDAGGVNHRCRLVVVCPWPMRLLVALFLFDKGGDLALHGLDLALQLGYFLR